MGLPILLEPVINIQLEVNVLSEVSWSSRGGVVQLSVGHQVSTLELHISSFIIFLEEAEGS